MVAEAEPLVISRNPPKLCQVEAKFADTSYDQATISDFYPIIGLLYYPQFNATLRTVLTSGENLRAST